MLAAISLWAVPVLLAAIPLYGWLKGVRVYEAFVEGAEEGLLVAWRVLPFMVAILTALAVFAAGGGMAALAELAAPLTRALGFPPEVLPLMVIRPLSGSGALGLTADLLRRHGPDSAIGRLASVMQGSTDTTFYVISVYFGSVGVVRARYAPLVGLAGDLVGFVAALAACRWYFGE